MIKTMKKSLVLAAAIAALSAIAVPSMASAVNWSPLNSYHVLSSPSSVTFNIPGGIGGSPPLGFSCSSGPSFAALVRTSSSPLLDMTSTTTNLPCTGTGVLVGCNVALTMIALPLWNVDGTSGLSNVKVNSVNIDATFTGACSGLTTAKVSGTLDGGVWSNLTRSLAFANDTGLNITFPWGPPNPNTFPVTVTASEFIKDTTSPFLLLN